MNLTNIEPRPITPSTGLRRASVPPRRSGGLLWSALVVALATLWATPAQAGHGGHRSQHLGGPQPTLRRHATQNQAVRVRTGASPAKRVRPAPAGANQSHTPSVQPK